MGYGQTLEKAWQELSGLTDKRRLSAAMLSDNYDLDMDNRTAVSSSCNIPSKDHITILLLHYLISKLKMGTLPPPSGDWMGFNQLEGGDAYYPAFRKRTIGHVIKKYGADPGALLKVSDRIPIKEVDRGDIGVIVQALEGVPILITMEKQDEEFGPDANILFDRSIQQIFCTEDIVVLTEFVVHSL